MAAPVAHVHAMQPPAAETPAVSGFADLSRAVTLRIAAAPLIASVGLFAFVIMSVSDCAIDLHDTLLTAFLVAQVTSTVLACRGAARIVWTLGARSLTACLPLALFGAGAIAEVVAWIAPAALDDGPSLLAVEHLLFAAGVLAGLGAARRAAMALSRPDASRSVRNALIAWIVLAALVAIGAASEVLDIQRMVLLVFPAFFVAQAVVVLSICAFATTRSALESEAARIPAASLCQTR